MHSKVDFVEASVAISISVTGMTMACIYHFHENGFFLGFIGFVISSIWLVVMVKENIKEKKVQQRQGRYRDNSASGTEMRNTRTIDVDGININIDGADDDEECNLQDKLEEYGCGLGCFIYVTYLLLVTAYIIIRAYVFTAHENWRTRVHSFPEVCSHWTQLSE